MRLPEGIVVNAKATFGELRFSALRREQQVQDEEGKATGEIKERVYDLKSKGQGMMIQVGIPASAGVKEYEYNADVELLKPVVDTVSVSTFGGRANAGWYIKADDIVVKGAAAKQEKQGAQPGSAETPSAKKG